MIEEKDQIAQKPFEPIKLKLKHPLILNPERPEEKVKELVFGRRMKARDLAGMPADLGQDEQMILVARLTEQLLPVIENLDAEDYLRAVGIAQGFLFSGPAGRKVGAK